MSWPGLPTIFVYDGYPGGAGFADRGYRRDRNLVGGHSCGHRGVRLPGRLPVVRAVPGCGNGNDPLDKAGAVRVLRLKLDALARH